MTPPSCDLLVIGGGINGAGIARDAAGRGLPVVLVERAGLGARVLVRTACVEAKREAGSWTATLSSGERLRARAIVNAAGPWVKEVLNNDLRQPSADNVRLVKGSHIVLPHLYEGEHAFIL